MTTTAPAITAAITRPATGENDFTLVRGEYSRTLYRVPGGFCWGFFHGKTVPIRLSPYGENFHPERVATLSPLERQAMSLIKGASIGDTRPLWTQDNADRPADMTGAYTALVRA
jgi:hypothetical protein